MKFLVLKTDNHKSQLAYIINSLNKDIKFSVYTTDKFFFDSLTLGKKNKKIIKSIQEPKTFGDFLFFTLFSPFIGLLILIKMIIAKSKKFNAILLTSLNDYLLVTPWARLLGIKVFWFRNTYFEKSFRANIYLLILRLYSRMVTLITTSQALSDYFEKEIGIRNKNIKTIPRGVDLEHLKIQSDIYEDLVQKDYQIQNKALFIIGFIGNLVRENGVEYLIKAVEHFKELIPDFQILIIGDGELKKELIWLTKVAGLTSHVRFVGQQDMIQRWYKYFNILVLPRTTKVEFSSVIAESMANGVPVVASDVDGIQEIVGDAGGILIPPNDAHALAEAIYLLYNDTDLREKFSKSAEERIRNNFSLEVMVENYRNIFK